VQVAHSSSPFFLNESDTEFAVSKINAIEKFLSHYKRPFTVVDVGARDGYLSFSAAAQNPQSVFTIIEGFEDGYYSNDLFHACNKKKELKNLILLRKSFTLENLVHLSTCEHFDVVLGINILHQFGAEWQNYAQALLRLGDHVIIDVPTKSNARYDRQLSISLENFIVVNGGKVIFEDLADKTKMYLISKNKTSISRKYWVADVNTRRQLKVISNFEHKFMVKSHMNYTRISPWIPGINLLTFKMMNGKFPRIRTLKKIVKTFDTVDHPDPFVWNLVVQGSHIALIDWDPLAVLKFDPAKCAKFNVYALSLYDPLEIKTYILQFNNEREKYTKYGTGQFLDRILESMSYIAEDAEEDGE
jgi:hypothetical protein